jgi:hypothetical protein
MRTKTMLLSALLGGLGSVSVMAQTNVYSLNVVGYINATMPPGYTIITCPLIVSPNNTIATILNNTNSQFQNPGRGETAFVYEYTNGAYLTDQAEAANAPSGWANNGTITMNAGQAVFFYNPTTTNMYATFVGTVPSGSLTNYLAPGFNLVGSMVPMSGDLVTNPISDFATNGASAGRSSDYALMTTPSVGYYEYLYSGGAWTPGDPTITNVYQGFFFYNAFATNNWIETYNP